MGFNFFNKLLGKTSKTEFTIAITPTIDENTQNLWNIEAKKRRDEIRNYTVESIPGEEALSQVRRILEK